MTPRGAVLPVAALVLVGAGLLLWPRVGVPDLDEASARLVLPGSATSCAGALRCSRTDLSPQAAVQAIGRQVHDLGLHDQTTSCTPRDSAPGQSVECRLTVRRDGGRLVVVTTGTPDDDVVRVSLTQG